MKFLVLLTLSLLSLTIMADAQPRFEKKQFFVKLKKNQSFPETQSKISHKKLFGDVYLVKTNDFTQATQELKNNAAVKFVEKSYLAGKRKLESADVIVPFSDPVKHPFNDPKTDKLWAFSDTDKGGMAVSKAYGPSMLLRKEEVIVAVVDTGVDYNHDELQNVMWINEGEIADNGIDDDGNGYVDDVYGINTLVRDEDGVASGNPISSHAHGTHVSGTIAAEQNNGIGITGVASTVKIMAIRTVPDNGDETDVNIVESFLYAAKNGAKIINCSFGKALNEGGMIVSETIKHIGEEYGVLVVAAAGNSSQDIDTKKAYPASFTNDHLLVVAATKNGGALAYFSNTGKIGVDLAAPGMNILSTIPGNDYDSYSGTSMAAPNTAGVAAEVLSNFPDLGPLELKKLLMDSVFKRDNLTDKTVTGGIVNLYQALEQGFVFKK